MSPLGHDSAPLDASPDPILALDPDGRVVGLNRAAEAAFGLSSGEVVGQAIWRLVAPDLGPNWWTQVGEQLGQRIELEARRGDGSQFPVELSLVRPAGGEQTRYCFLRDVSERRRVEAELERQRRRAESANEAKSRFLANMSHEIRTPLSGILGYADLVGRFRSHAERDEWIEQIRRHADHLLALLNDILDLSKIEAGEMNLEIGDVNLFRLMFDLEQLMRSQAHEKALELTIECQGQVPDVIQTDPVRLRQILINLLSNAIKFTARGSVNLVASVLEADHNDGPRRLRITVSDTGCGIPADRLEEIFRPFSQVDSGANRTHSGTGLGLDISRRLAQLLGGELEVRSVVDQGSTFSLELPLITNAEELAQAAARGGISGLFSHSSDQFPDLSGRRVLVTDDHRANRDVIRLLLEEMGAEVLQAEDGQHALEVVAEAARGQQPLDLILMDMQMPGVDGYEATRRLRSQGVGTPIVALTANAMTGDRTTCLDAGCSEYLSKPIVPRSFFSCVRRVLEDHVPGPAGAAAEEPQQPEVPQRESAPEAATQRQRPSGGATRSMVHDPRMQALIASYVGDMPRMADELEAGKEANDMKAVRTSVHRLAGTAGSYGFPRITNLSRSLEVRLREGFELHEVEVSFRELVALLRTTAAERGAP